MEKIIKWFTAQKRQIIYVANAIVTTLVGIGLLTDVQASELAAIGGAILTLVASALALLNLTPDESLLTETEREADRNAKQAREEKAVG